MRPSASEVGPVRDAALSRCPLTRLSEREAVSAVGRAVLRGVRPRNGSDWGVRQALAQLAGETTQHQGAFWTQARLGGRPAGGAPPVVGNEQVRCWVRQAGQSLQGQTSVRLNHDLP